MLFFTEHQKFDSSKGARQNKKSITLVNTNFESFSKDPFLGYIRGADSKYGISFRLSRIVFQILMTTCSTKRAIWAHKLCLLYLS